MNSEICYNCQVKGLDMVDNKVGKSYVVKAADKQVAMAIATNMFVAEFGTCNDFKVTAAPKKISEKDSATLLSAFSNEFQKLSEEVQVITTFDKFLDLYIKQNGSEYNSQGMLSSFVIEKYGLVVKVMYIDGRTTIDTSLMLYKKDLKTFVIENNWKDFFLG